jgi:Ca-activated chloride channel homolog
MAGVPSPGQVVSMPPKGDFVDQQRGKVIAPWLVGAAIAGFGVGCRDTVNQPSGLEIQILVGSALGDFCNQAAAQLNQQNPKLKDGQVFYLSCTAKGSGDIVAEIVALAQRQKTGAIPPDDPKFPVLLSLDGDIYQNQLQYELNRQFPGQNYIPGATDAPLIATSPMVFMTSTDLAPSLQKHDLLFKQLVTAKTHQNLDPGAPPIKINFVQTAPTRSNSGLQTLVTQFSEVSGKPPESLSIDDIQKFQSQVQKIQSKVARYGVSTQSLAQSMVQNGTFWASIGSVYESSVIAANANQQSGQTRYQAVYPKATFTSNMRAILPQAPWVSASEKEAAEQIIRFFQLPDTQKIATSLGLRPATPGVPLGAKFIPENGVNPKAQYDSLRPPKPEIVETMLKSWTTYAKKPSLVVLVVDSSGSMQGQKIAAVQQTLQAYINQLGPKDQVALINFSSDIQPPVFVDATSAGKTKGIEFISRLEAKGGTSLYDAALSARNWLQTNYRDNAINAVVILTDGEDSGSQISLDQLGAELKKTGVSSDQRIGFFTVGYGKEGEFNPNALKQIATLNAGYYVKGDPETIAQVMSNLQVEF